MKPLDLWIRKSAKGPYTVWLEKPLLPENYIGNHVMHVREVSPAYDEAVKGLVEVLKIAQSNMTHCYCHHFKGHRNEDEIRAEFKIELDELQEALSAFRKATE